MAAPTLTAKQVEHDTPTHYNHWGMRLTTLYNIKISPLPHLKNRPNPLGALARNHLHEIFLIYSMTSEKIH